jgi:uroporphyrin-III C-methyltransferase/precorrin-2 dehydrogenase/sirohydrochlorin ferrochelatase
MSEIRTPHSETPRIQNLSVLPLFFKLAGKRVLLAGQGEGIGWKKELLLSTGAEVIRKVAWEKSDFHGVTLALFDGAEEEARRFFETARGLQIPVNCVDRPEFCDFSFGSIVNRSPLVVGISTDGAAPTLAQIIRTKIEALLPQSLSVHLIAARKLRQDIKTLSFTSEQRKNFWQRFALNAFSENAPLPLDTKPAIGRLSLVGAGPGDPELLTLKALQALQTADVILFDDLVSDGVLELSRREATRIGVGKRGHKPSCKQADINALILSEVREGKHVVRLKSGDPMIFGRAGEEIEAVEAAGFEVSIISGITAAQAAAASLKKSLTHRDYAQRIQYITGHSKAGELPETLNWASIADEKVSTVLYMPLKTLSEFSQKALAAGLAQDTPMHAVYSVSLGNENTIKGTLQTLPSIINALPLDAPAIVMLGRAFT